MKLLQIKTSEKDSFICFDKVVSVSFAKGTSEVQIYTDKKRFTVVLDSPEEAEKKYSQLKGLFASNEPIIEV